jgi:hypothetical protein
MTLNVSGTQIVSDTRVITNAPNLTATGTVTATAFVGNGSALTGIAGGGGLVSSTVQAVTASTSATTINTASGGIIDLTLSSNTTITITNSATVNLIYIRILGPGGTGSQYTSGGALSGSTGYSIAWPSSVRWDGGPAFQPDTENNSVVNVSLYTKDGGTTWDARVRVTTLNYTYVTETRTPGRMYAAGHIDWRYADGVNSFVYPDNVLRSSLTAIGTNTDWLEIRANGNAYVYSIWGIRSNGTLWSWGSPCSQGTGYNGGLYGFTTFADGYPYSSSPVQVGTDTDWWKFGSRYSSAPDVVLKKDGSAWWWTDKRAGTSTQITLGSKRFSPTMIFPGQWKTIGGTFVANSSLAHCAGVKADGSLWVWGSNYNKGAVFPLQAGDITPVYSPIQWGTEKDWADIHFGGGFYFLVKDDGRIFTFGRNDMAQLPANSTPLLSALSSPVLLASGARYKQFSAFGYGWAGMKADGSVWMAGGNGQTSWMGINNTGAYYSSPVQLPGTWSQIQTGNGGNSGHMYAIKSDGTLWGSGIQDVGALGIGTTSNVSSITQISSNTGWVNLGFPGIGYAGVGMIAMRST